LFLSPKPYPHKCAEAGARTRDLPVTDGRLYRCTRPALLFYQKEKGKKIEMMVKAYKYHFSVSKLLSKNPTAISTIIVDQGTTLIL